MAEEETKKTENPKEELDLEKAVQTTSSIKV